eukprot:5847040-Pyramimonas_sp.AAC.1
MSVSNRRLLAYLGILQHQLAMPILVGGDFNMEPSHIQRTDLCLRGRFQVIAPALPTLCPPVPQTPSKIDYFL